MRGLRPGADAGDAERQWLTLWLGTEGQEWAIEERTRASQTAANLERVEVRSSTGERLRMRHT